MNLRLTLGLTTILASSICRAQAPTLNLYTFDSPPYQVASEITEPGRSGTVFGETTETVVCAANRAGWSTRIRVAPQNRAMHSLKRSLVNGYFAIDPSIELDNIARRSDPVALEKWYFFTTEEGKFNGNARIGVVDGSNEQAWLKDNGYTIFMSVASPSQLLALLRRGRIGTALMDERVMTDLQAENHAAGALGIKAHFVRYAPLHLYLTESFVALHPKFLPEFNRMLPACMTGQLALSETEESRIRALADRLIKELHGTLNIHQAVEAGPRQQSFTDVMTQDSVWQVLAPDMPTALASYVLQLPGSRALHGWKVAHNGLVSEAMVINDMGTLAAMSELTSDYWQGDEPKYQEVVKNTRRGLVGLEALYISPIRFDASTSQFQVTISAPVEPIEEGVPRGIIVLGLNAEEALHSQDIP
ncbi:hypothetical protein [Marinobacter sp.]|uniref:hypothetical protein n=1 Tax=Marinobacter sp. TaxID=50741 RepID=UPI003A90F662